MKKSGKILNANYVHFISNYLVNEASEETKDKNEKENTQEKVEGNNTVPGKNICKGFAAFFILIDTF